ncbi:uncharacterized protein LOC116412877 [Galleria mellonella]|uniref:Uncharacterized protein LOC116412877 n=1 Tax=Galleria mellonella TaxID=7137 RepID=A0A6J3C0T5_GALME|nr:uncharacterized protein LOC116412877 [Galleria mellonella]
MFYDRKLMNSSYIKNIWRAANDQNTNLEDEKLPDICGWLDKWIGSDCNDGRSRLSLRTAAVLIDGAAKVYERKLKRLFEDIDNLEKDMIKRNRLNNVGLDDCSLQSTENDDVSLTSSDEKSKGPDTSNNESNLTDGSSNEMSSRDEDNVPRCTIENSDDISNSEYVGQLSTSIELIERTNTEKTIENQTSTTNEGITEGCSFDKDLPFGYIMVYDNVHDRIPSKIIFSSFDRKIKKLI